MQQLMRNKGKKFSRTDEVEVTFENIKRKLCQAPVLGVTTKKEMFVSDTDASLLRYRAYFTRNKSGTKGLLLPNSLW